MSRTAHKLMASSGGDTGYEIDQSILCSTDDASKLRRTPSSEGNRKTFTFSTWVKRSDLGNDVSGGGEPFKYIMGASVTSGWSNDSHYFAFGFYYTDTLIIQGWNTNWRLTNRKFRDTSAWYHLMFQFDTTQGTADNRVKLYVNGVEETSFATKNNPSQNYDVAINNTVPQSISDVAYDSGTGPYHFDGYMAETHFFDGAVVAPSEFGETDPVSGQWIPKEYTGTTAYGTNGYYLDFANNTENGVTAAASTFTAPFGGTASNATADDGNYIITNTTTGAAFDLWHVDLGSAKNVISILQHNVKFTGGTSTFKVYYSNDNSNWTETASFSVSASYQDLNTSQGIAARYWKMRATAFGVNGEGHVDFVNLTIGGIGADASGKGNDYTPTNLANADVVLDTPTNNFSTLNGIQAYNTTTGVLTQGNLFFAAGAYSSGHYSNISSTFNVPGSGKWYAECRISIEAGTGNVTFFGVTDQRINWLGVANENLAGADGLFSSIYGNYIKVCDSGTVGTGNTSATANSYILGMALDVDNGYAYFGVDSGSAMVWYKADGSTSGGDPTSGSTGTGGFARTFTTDDTITVSASVSSDAGNGSQNHLNFGQNGTFSGTETAGGNTDGNGYGNFFRAPPSGYLALCTKNLPTPTIKKSSENFNTVIYTGTGSTRSITGVGHQPDWLWIKSRSGTDDHRLQDAVRGSTKYLESNTHDAEVTDASGITAFGSDGFTIGADSASRFNVNTTNYVAWSWKANGSGSSNSDGATSSTVSANTSAGFSIVTYSGTGSATTIGHGLGVVPAWIVVKNRTNNAGNTDAWANYHQANTAAPETDALYWDTTYATSDDAGTWNDTAPTSSVFTVNNWGGVNASGDTYIAYVFAEVKGFSKFGSYLGNGQAEEGPFVYTGFTPRFVLQKKSSAANTSWFMWDSKRHPENVIDLAVWADATNGDTSHAEYEIDFLSNGFKLRGNNAGSNADGATHVYMAFAEAPFKYANAR